jgi:hypothetical protein
VSIFYSNLPYKNKAVFLGKIDKKEKPNGAPFGFF